MGLVYLKDKPEAESFSYAYVEDAEGAIRRVSLVNIKTALGINAIYVDVTMYANAWAISTDGTYYTQNVNVLGITEHSQVNLQPTPTQLISLLNNGTSLFIATENGIATAYAVGSKPDTDLVMQATRTEVL